MRRLIQIAVLLLLVINLGGPLFETVDRWDQFAQGGDDLVLSVLGVIAGLGLSLLLVVLLRFVIPPALLSAVPGLVSLTERTSALLDAARPAPLTSPPLPLRI